VLTSPGAVLVRADGHIGFRAAPADAAALAPPEAPQLVPRADLRRPGRLPAGEPPAGRGGRWQHPGLSDESKLLGHVEQPLLSSGNGLDLVSAGGHAAADHKGGVFLDSE
jgi:hypothetical protein